MSQTLVSFEGKAVPQSYMDAMRDGSSPPVRDWIEKPTISQRFWAALPLVSAKDSYLEGIDLSKWQGSWDVQKSIEAGASYAFVKATQNDFVDTRFDEYVNKAHIADFPIGVYHFADPWGKSAIAQAQYFASVVKGVGELSAVLDLEWNGGLSIYALENWAHDFMLELGVQLGSRLLEIYTRVSWWNTNVASAPWANQYGLWVARWASWLDGPWSDGKYIPRDWMDWTNWQWSSDGNGLGATYGVESASIDLNYFNGDLQAFKDHYKLNDTPPPCDCDQIEKKLIDLTDEIEAMKTDTNNRFEIYQDQLDELDRRIRELEDEGGSQDTLNVVVNPGGNAVAFVLLDYDRACENAPPDYDGPVGKPIAEPPTENRVVYKPGQTFKIRKTAWASCKDNPNDWIVHGAGFDFAIIADGYPGKGDFVRLDKISVISL